MDSSSVATIYATWAFFRSFLHRGWWLVTSLYLVTEAALSPFQLVFLGTAQGLTVLAAEIPTGVLADTYSRKWSLVAAHALMGLGMLSTGLVLSFPALVITQMIWGLSWTFSTGADVAWMTDELDQPGATAAVLVRAAKWQQAGSALGILVIGALAWATSLSAAMVSAGTCMWLLGLVVAVVFRETKFQRPATRSGLAAAIGTLREGYGRLRAYRILIHILLCTFLVNGADEAFGRLNAKHLVDLGLPQTAEPIVWLTLLALAGLTLGISTLALLERYLSRGEGYARAYGTGTVMGALGLALFASAPSAETAAIGVLLVGGVAMSVLRTVSVVWANRHASSQVRATTQSFLSLAENFGEISLGFLLALLAEAAGIPAAMVGSSGVLWLVLLLVVRRARGSSTLRPPRSGG